jgi:hypothetical protein
MTTKSKTEKTKVASIVTSSDLLEEDGWIFRERPGVPVECVGRAVEGPSADAKPLYHSRNNYPST